MALSPADFAAYSRATGTPYPETPEERAEKALEVREFRQNQLQQPSDRQSEAAALGLGIGLGLAGLGGAALALRKGKKMPKKTGGPRGGQSGIGFADIPPPSSPPPGPAPTGGGGGSPASPAPIRYLDQDNVLRSVSGPEVDEFFLTVRSPEKRGLFSNVLQKSTEDLPQVTRPTGAVSESMLITDPNTGEVYRRGGQRSIRQLEAQPTLVEAQDMVGDVQASIQSKDAVQSASDQADARFESVIQRDIDSVRDGKAVVAQEFLSEQVQAAPIYSVETPGPAPSNEARIAREELKRRGQTEVDIIQTEQKAKDILSELAGEYSPQETIGLKRSQLQDVGLKGGRLEKVLGATTGPDVRSALEGISIQDLPERTVVNIGPEAEITKAASGGAIRGAGRIVDVPGSKERTRQIFGTPDELVTGALDETMADIPGARRAPELPVQEEIGGGGAGVGVYGRETDYVPGAVSKQTGEYSAAAQRKPTDTTGFKTLSDKPTPYQGLSDQDLGQLTMLGSEAEAYNAERELAKRRSFDVSRDIRRIQSSGRPDAQQLVKDYIKNLGLES